MMYASEIGSPHLFLNNRFPSWKDDNKTYMIPPIIKAKPIKVGIKETTPAHEKGDQGEIIIFDLISQLGSSDGIGMFVINGFELKHITAWNKACTKKDYLLQNILSDKKLLIRECDFIIFHHTLGIISLEVKNYAKVSDRVVKEAQEQIATSRDLIAKFAALKVKEEYLYLPHRKVIALPSTKKSEFNFDEFPSLHDDTFVLFAEDSEDVESFRKWWKKMIATSAEVCLKEEEFEPYERALAYTMMIRHLGPITEYESIAELHEYLVSYKYHGKSFYSQVIENKFPNFYTWCRDVLTRRSFDMQEETAVQLREDFMRSYKLNAQKLASGTGIKKVEEILKLHKYISGDEPTATDEALALLFEEKHLLFFRNIIRFFIDMRQEWATIDNEKNSASLVERFPFTKLESVKDANILDRHLERSSFLNGDTPNWDDKELFESLMCKLRVKHALKPMVMTSEQLAVYEGPKKQLIIGPPGSGKTELMKFKALDLEMEMKACKSDKRILFIVCNGAPKRESLLFYNVNEFFKYYKSTYADVVRLTLEEKFPIELQNTIETLRKKIGKYSHVFIDEYWIGSKPAEQEITLELINRVPGYVWISSVFDYRRDLIDTHEKMKIRTKPLLTTLHENGGVVNHITQVLRATNNVINLERKYCNRYQERTYPYGPKQILGHSLEGWPVTWIVERGVKNMYVKCAEIISTAIENVKTPDVIRREKLILDPADILVVNFASRSSSSENESLAKSLGERNILFWAFGESVEEYLKCKTGNVAVMNSLTRKDSDCLDGTEWPMVIIILPSGVLMNTAKLAKGAEELRNYDPYIAFFRVMVRLVVISDKWRNDDEFLTDISQKC